MQFDALCLACIRDELEKTLVPGRVQQVLLPGPHSIGLEVYSHQRRRQLLIQCQPDDPRVHLVAGKLRRGVEAETPLLLLLRKYVRDALLTAVRQPNPAERVLELGFEHRDHGAATLVVELLGRATNLILRRGEPAAEGGTILDCLLRFPPGEKVRRVLLPGRPYVLPPAQAKLPPLDDGTAGYYERLAQITQADGPLWKELIAQIAGISPVQAHEIALRVCGDAGAPARAASTLALVQAIQALWSPVHTGAWQPGLWRAGGAALGYSSYAAHSAAEFVPMPTLSAAIEEVAASRAADAPRAQAAAASSGRDPYAAQRRAVADLLRRAGTRIDRQLEALARDEPPPGAAAALRVQAEWLLALATRVRPGDRVLSIPPEESGGGLIEIALDPALAPVAQAERWFDRAAKLERAAEFIPQRRAHLENDRRYLADLEGDLALAQSQPEIAAVRQEIYDAGLLPAPLGRKPERVPRAGGPRRFAAEGFLILAGRNATQNDRLTFEIAQPADLWLHVRGAPGSHVVVQAGGRAIPEPVVLVAAQVAGYFSSLRGETAVDVVVTERRHVSRVPGGRPGQVLLRKERTLRAAALLPEGLREQ